MAVQHDCCRAAATCIAAGAAVIFVPGDAHVFRNMTDYIRARSGLQHGRNDSLADPTGAHRMPS